ncbi:lactococcin 972 family bacteriocin [Clostridium sp.]|jgi:hypothetical protein|uniref:lactococcin 972 family bacteriocin n=1 Tax=Clostridium sp. TaxID=1506 RepID=UPI003EEEA208
MIKKSKLKAITVAMALTLSITSQAMAAPSKMATSGSIDLTNAPINSGITPFTSVSVGGGTWNYGTSLVPKFLHFDKKVYSNYLHATKKHHSSCSIGGLFSTSGVTAAKSMSASSAVGKTGDATVANWDVD